MKKLRTIFALLAIAGTIAGCSSTPPREPSIRLGLGVLDGTVEYEEIQATGLSLKMISQATVYAGEETSLIFALSNDGRRTVSIPEWYSHEPDNIVVYVQPWLTNMTEPDENSWITLSFDLKEPILHYPLTLMPGNKVLISKELAFIQMLQVSEGKMRRFFVKASLNLKSLKLETEVIALQVLPRRQSSSGEQ